MKKLVSVIVLVSILATADAQGVRRIKIADLEKTIRESKTPLIINFWATYCVPCLEEIPYFEKAVRKHVKDSVRLLLVSLDLREDYGKIKPFAVKRKFTSPIFWLNETNADYFCPKVDSNWSGALPATLFINNKTGYRKFLEEKIKEEKLQNEIMAILRK